MDRKAAIVGVGETDYSRRTDDTPLALMLAATRLAAKDAGISALWKWVAATGRGRVYSWTIVHQAFHPAFAADVPYAILLGKMEEGVMLIARLAKRDMPNARLTLNLPLQVEFDPVSDEIDLPTFCIAQAVYAAPGKSISLKFEA